MARGPKIPRFGSKALCGISHRFQWLSPSKRQIPKCYSPVRRSSSSSKLEMLPLDLHVLSLPPAFNLSHDQTLQFKILMQVSFRTASLMNVWFLLFCKGLSFKSSTSCQPKLVFSRCFILQVPTQITWLDKLLKSVASSPKQEAYSTLQGSEVKGLCDLIRSYFCLPCFVPVAGLCLSTEANYRDPRGLIKLFFTYFY